MHKFRTLPNLGLAGRRIERAIERDQLNGDRVLRWHNGSGLPRARCAIGGQLYPHVSRSSEDDYAASRVLTASMSRSSMERTSLWFSVTSAWVLPDPVTNSTSKPSGAYTSTTAPMSPILRLCSGRSFLRTTVSSSFADIVVNPDMQR